MALINLKFEINDISVDLVSNLIARNEASLSLIKNDQSAWRRSLSNREKQALLTEPFTEDHCTEKDKDRARIPHIKLSFEVSYCRASSDEISRCFLFAFEFHGPRMKSDDRTSRRLHFDTAESDSHEYTLLEPASEWASEREDKQIRGKYSHPDRLTHVSFVAGAGIDHAEGHPRCLLGVRPAPLVQSRRHAVRVAYCLYLKINEQ